MLAPPPKQRTLAASYRDLESLKPEVRVSAIEDLVRNVRADEGERAKALAAIEKLLADAHPRVRGTAAVALADLDAKEAVGALGKVVADEDAWVRQMAMNALGELGDSSVLPLLRKALSDRRPDMRYQAIIAFSRVEKDDGAVDKALLEATNDDDDAIVHIALRLVEERLDEGKTPDGRLLSRAKTLMKSESVHLSVVSAIVLAKAGDATGHDIVLAVVRGERVRGQKPEKEDEQAAVELAGAIGLESARPALEKRAWGLAGWVKDTSKFHARIALARMGHPRAIDEILKELGSGSREVVSAAVVAAGRGRVRDARAPIAKLTAAMVDPELAREALALLEDET